MVTKNQLSLALGALLLGATALVAGCGGGGTPGAVCGNHKVETGEQCDDGNTVSGDGCSSTCMTESMMMVCGNGMKEGTEECDNGTANSNTTPDACRTSCKKASCGDGVIDTGETCDDGNTTAGDGCDATCQIEAVCGNGKKEGTEECDNGTNNSDTAPDACRTDCKKAHCGDMVKDMGEACDDGNMVNGDGCENDCTLPTCGNHVMDPGEACDDGNKVNGDGCDNNCTVSACGNAIAAGTEACDATDLKGKTCATLGGFSGGTLACQADCTAFDTTGCLPFVCGDGIKNGTEVCDNVDGLAGHSCMSLGFDGGVVGCKTDCTGFDTSGCFHIGCGDGVAQGTEACDGADLLGHVCKTVPGTNFSSGTLACKVDCTFDTSMCVTNVCGDDITAGPTEVCDGTDLSGQDCETIGGTTMKLEGALSCLSDCTNFDSTGCHTAVCGNGLRGGGEQCDDGNTTNGDGCSNTCTLVVTQMEAEPNDDGSVAPGAPGVGNDFSATNANVVNLTAGTGAAATTASAYVQGAITPVGDEDVYKITNPDGANSKKLDLETYGHLGFTDVFGLPVGNECQFATDDTLLTIRDAAGASLRPLNVIGDPADDKGTDSCSRITSFTLAPGQTVFVTVMDSQDNVPISLYTLRVFIHD